jgi:ribosomal protein L37AE/L43A
MTSSGGSTGRNPVKEVVMMTRMDEASLEQQEKSAFVCKSCDKRYSHGDAAKQDMSCCGEKLTKFEEIIETINRDPSPAGP